MTAPWRPVAVRVDDLRADLDGGASAADVLEGVLGRVETIDRAGPTINAVATLAGDAPAAAAAIDRAPSRTARGALHGIPVLVKDCIEIAGVETRFGCALFRGYVPEADAVVVRRVRAAGGVVVGTTTMPDLATSLFSASSASGLTRNPLDLDRDPGGSSSGAAAAVAAGLVPLAIGTDNGGSIRIPAAFCGLVGLRPTPRRISRSGTSPLVPRQDTVGPIAGTVRDARRLYGVLSGAGTVVAPSTGDRRLRVGVLREAFSADTDPDDRVAVAVGAIVSGALAALGGHGVDVVEIPPIADLAGSVEASSLFLLESRAAIDAFLAARPGSPVPSLRALVDHPDRPAGLELLELMATGPADPAQDPRLPIVLAARRRLRHRLLGAMRRAEVDALAYPTVRAVAPPSAAVAARTIDVFTFPSNALIASHASMPAITVPVGRMKPGLPVGCELLGRPWQEALLLDLAECLESAVA